MYLVFLQTQNFSYSNATCEGVAPLEAASEG